MKVTHWTDSKEVIDMKVEDIITYDLAATDEDLGEIESMKFQIAKLSEFISKLIALLPEDEAKKIISDLCFYHKPSGGNNG